MINSLEKKTSKEIDTIKLSYEQESNEFAQNIKNMPKDIPAFENMLKSLLFKAD